MIFGLALKIDYTMRLPDDQYFPAARKKSGIAIHHTVGGSALSTVAHWLKDRTRSGKMRLVGTAYIIDRDGTVNQVFPPTAWAFQFGVKWPAAEQLKFEQRFIGIELASEGGLLEASGRLYCYDRISAKTVKPRSEAFDYGTEYRGYRYFDKYEAPQLDSLVSLINHLCDTYSIERRVPYPPLDFYGDRLADFKGIIGHAMVRSDKTDPAPMKSFWDRLTAECRLTRMPNPQANQSEHPVLTDDELERLFASNIHQIRTLAVAAGSVVKGLVMELERRDTYLRLYYAEHGGHRVEYEFLSGNEDLVKRLAAAFGIECLGESMLQVHHG
jgi:N-acetyl-anhydromuramyl-L-alanine amidase AmpD